MFPDSLFQAFCISNRRNGPKDNDLIFFRLRQCAATARYRQPTPETAFRHAEQGDVSTFYRVGRNRGYALSGELPRPKPLQIARAICDQLTE